MKAAPDLVDQMQGKPPPLPPLTAAGLARRLEQHGYPGVPADTASLRAAILAAGLSPVLCLTAPDGKRCLTYRAAFEHVAGEPLTPTAPKTASRRKTTR